MDVVSFYTGAQFIGFSIQLHWYVELKASASIMSLGVSFPAILGSKDLFTVYAFIVIAGTVSSFHVVAYI